MRLVDGGSHHEGRVEVYYKNSWGTICDATWNTKAASVVCRQLGLPNALHNAWAQDQAFFGPGSGMIVFDDIDCTGEESEISQCSYSDPGSNRNPQCDHFSDASVMCGEMEPDGKTIRLYFLVLPTLIEKLKAAINNTKALGEVYNSCLVFHSVGIMTTIIIHHL